MPKIQIAWSFWLLMAVLMLTLPLSWVLSAISSAAVHELCHIGMLKYLGIPIIRFRIQAGGAILDTGPTDDKAELLCALAGPVGSFLLLIFLYVFPRIALCGLVQGIYNLIPVKNLDGGRVIRCAIRLIHGNRPCKPEKMRVQ